MQYNRTLYEFSSRAIVVKAQLKQGERGNYISYMNIPLIHPTKKTLECTWVRVGIHVRASIFDIDVLGYIYMMKILWTSSISHTYKTLCFVSIKFHFMTCGIICGIYFQ